VYFDLGNVAASDVSGLDGNGRYAGTREEFREAATAGLAGWFLSTFTASTEPTLQPFTSPPPRVCYVGERESGADADVECLCFS